MAGKNATVLGRPAGGSFQCASSKRGLYQSIMAGMICTKTLWIQESGSLEFTRKIQAPFRSNLNGMPMAQMLLSMDATVTTCHSKTENIEQHLRNADIALWQFDFVLWCDTLKLDLM